MKTRHASARTIATWLATHAEKVLPPDRADWAKAMRNEIHHLPGNRAALTWAIGCVFAGYRERIHAMKIGSPRVSLWILSLEMLICFVPLTLLCLAIISVVVVGVMPAREGILYFSAAAIGPIGLMVACKVIMFKRASLNWITMAALGGLAAWTVVAYTLQLLTGNGTVIEWWREFVLIALLPAVGVAHLIFMTVHSARKLPAG